MDLVLNQLKLIECGNEMSRSINGLFDHSVIVYNFIYIQGAEKSPYTQKIRTSDSI